MVNKVYGHYYSEAINGLDGVTDFSDVIYGYGGDDAIWGLGGWDLIYGGAGADDIYGGSGVDTSSYSDSQAGVVVSLITGLGFGGYAEGDTLHSIENLTGSDFDDFLVGDGGENILIGDHGDDTLKGGGGADTLYGGGDNDWIDGGTGIDTMIGGEGDDTYQVNSASDVVTEASGEGNDTVYSTAFTYTLADNAEILSLDTVTDTGVYATGNAAHNTIFGNGNDNVLNGGGANDILSGLGGNDTFVFQAGQAHGDVVYEFNGNGAGLGDVLRFSGYGPGATFTQASATEWIITSGDGTIQEVITLVGAPAIDASDYAFI